MHGKPYKFALVVVMAALLSGVLGLQKSLNRQRAGLGLTRAAPLENAPPVLAFTTVALGGFRGLIANALWIRANDLQQQDKYFEQVQLSDWITKLEPHFTQVWLMQAWNMAYNISVKFRNPYDRWRWVQRGIELLRDEGLKYNPREALIYRELAWFFQHKMGQNLDDAHLIYKYEWAKEMTLALGGGRPNFDELLNPRTEQARARVQLLREKYKMDPAAMKRLDDLHGPLEWRLPEAQAMYWALVGLENSTVSNQITLRRVLYGCLHTYVLRGRIVATYADGSLEFGPDVSKIPPAHDAYEKMITEETDKPEVVRRAHRNFLREAVWVLYSHNRLEEARRWMTVLKSRYPAAVPEGFTVEQFALDRLTSSMTDVDHNRKRIFIYGLIESHFKSLILDDEERADGTLMMARQIWTYYDQSVQNRQGVLKLAPFPKLYQDKLDELLNPQTGLNPEAAARLRTQLHLPAPAPATNAPQPAPRP